MLRRDFSVGRTGRDTRACNVSLVRLFVSEGGRRDVEGERYGGGGNEFFAFFDGLCVQCLDECQPTNLMPAFVQKRLSTGTAQRPSYNHAPCPWLTLALVRTKSWKWNCMACDTPERRGLSFFLL